MMLATHFKIGPLVTAILVTATVLVLTHLPQTMMPLPLQESGIDKLQHVLAYGTIMLLSLISLRNAPTVFSVLLLCLVVSAIGVLDELTQPLVNRTASVADLAADVVGMLSALVVYTVLACVDEPEEQATDRWPYDRSFGSGYADFPAAHKPERGTSGLRIYVVWIALATYLLFLAYRALYPGDGDITSLPIWELQSSRRLLAWIGWLAFISLWEFVKFVPVGFLTTRIVPRRFRGPRWFPISLAALVVASTLTVLLHALRIGWPWHSAEVAALALPLLGCLFGTWMGATWLRGRRARVLFLPKIALLIFIAIIGTGAVLWLAVDDRPLPFEAARVTSAEKRRLVHLVRSKSPRSLKEGQIQTLRLTDHDINLLLSWGLSLGSPNRKAKVGLARDYAVLSASIGLPLGGGKTRYLNLEADGNSEIEDGLVSLNVYRCRLGSMKIPRWFLDILSSTVTSLLNHNRFSRPFTDAIRAVSIEPDLVEVTYGRVDLPAGFREDLLARDTASEEVLASTRAQVDNLLAVVAQTPGTQPTFDACFETVFAFARERSVEKDPVTENRAGIFALGVLLGHHRIAVFLGPVLPDRDYLAARRALRRVTLRERSDWTKHFCVSAAIAILSDEVSDAAGLLKEELDAGRGGSGFSFADLLADRAGTTFAVVATRDEVSARAMQDRLSRGFLVEEFFPPTADLPEEIPDAELQSRYGGVGGQAYNRLIEEIERRIAACAAYR